MKRVDKPIFYERHALRRMNHRGVSEDQVEQTIRKPDQQRRANREGGTRFEKRFSRNKRLALIVDEEKALICVVTAFWM
jgi:hypothetical protein